MLLSTHIVEDVSDLCPRMAILAGGRVVLEGEPARLIAELHGRLWRKTVPKSAVEGYRASHHVIATRLFGGRTQIHVLADGPPEPGFEPAPPDLEDVYFSGSLRSPAASGGDRVLSEIVRFEWRYHSRQVAFIAASLLFFLLGFALSVTQFGPDNVAVNSPYLVMEGVRADCRSSR